MARHQFHDDCKNRKCIPPNTKQSDYPLVSESKINAPNVSKLLTKGIMFRLSTMEIGSVYHLTQNSPIIYCCLHSK